MTRPGRPGPSTPLLDGTFGGNPDQPDGAEPTPDCCEVAEGNMPDRAANPTVLVPTDDDPSFALVQSVDGTGTASFAFVTATFDDPVTAGNLLVAGYTIRGDSDPDTPAGWTRIGPIVASTDDNRGRSALFYRIADGSETAITVHTTSANHSRLSLAEFDGAGSLLDYAAMHEPAAGNSYPTGPVDVVEDGLAVGLVHVSHEPITFVDDGDFTLMESGRCGSSFGPTDIFSYRIEPADGTDTYTPTQAGSSQSWAGILASFSGGAGDFWSGQAPEVVDGDDATYIEVTGTDLVRLDLGAAFRITRTRIRIAGTNAGARTLTIRAWNELDESDAVTLTTIDFTATGSFTAQNVVGSWYTEDSYRYFELSIDDSDTYRLHTWELYEPTLATNHQHDAPALDDLTDVDAPTPADGDVLTWVDADSEWQAVAPTGGGGVTVEDEGTPLTTTATTLDFVGAGVTATGAGASKTITIPGGGSSAGGRGEYASKYNPDHETPATTPDVADEFNGSTTGTWTSAPGVIDDLTSQPGFYLVQGNTTERLLWWAFAPGATDVTVAAKFSVALGTTATGSVGIYVGDTTGNPANAVYCIHQMWGASNFETGSLYNENGAGSFSIVGAEIPLFAPVAAGTKLRHQIYLRLTRLNSGPTWTASLSTDGKVWHPLPTTGSKVLTIAAVGFRFDNNHAVALDWIRAWDSIVSKVGA